MKQNGYNFSHVGIRNCRRLRQVDVDLRPLMVLIGANGAGKTSFLDVWAMLARSASGGLNSFLSSRGGLAEILTRDAAPGTTPDDIATTAADASQTLALDLTMTVPGHQPLEYKMSLGPRGSGYQICAESLIQANPVKGGAFKYVECAGSNVHYYDADTKKLVTPTWEYNGGETALSQVPKMFKEPELFRRQMASSTYYGPLNVGPQAPVRLPQQMRPAELPGKEGEDLVSCLYSLRETDRDRFEMVEDTLRAAFPDFERLSFPPVAAGMLSMTWKDRSFTQPMYMSQLSEGTLRYLWLTALLSSTALPAVTLIDEPEVSLHPELLMQLADQLRCACKRSQVMVATHSDRLVRFLEPGELLVCDMENGEASLQWADRMEDIEAWLTDYSLDVMWSMGKLGGRA